MIRTLLTSSAIALVLSTGAIAQTAPATPETPATTTTAPAAGTATDVTPGTDATTTTTGAGAMGEPWDMSAGYTAGEGDAIASELMGTPVYSSTGDDAEEIGTVNDLVISTDGEIQAVVIGVGGFLGIGEKNVAVDFGSLEHTIATDQTERWVLPTTAEALEAAPDFVWENDTAAMANDPAMTTPATPGVATDPAMAPADGAMAPADGAMAPAATPAADGTAMGTGAAMPREGYNTVERDALTADNLTGATVIGPNGDDIAEVGDILLDQSGQLEAMLVDFGGFLGIGQKRVAIGFDNIEFASNEAGDIVLYTDFTREQLEAAPEYNEEAYTADPAGQRINNM
ncbi:PRC-barrel domain-containing protein [Devosia crocina]|uniref:PRC-barrel domain-containing protein n=1 Tax=Devosia crocina TaxID=429728 RepID=A0A1I7MYB4_9HYPH|nr:PRC-barrel domain-containing protein [Devosia crocina]SFV27358.1 PRC-barrel domain-containing protein [Devosia crocina]